MGEKGANSHLEYHVPVMPVETVEAMHVFPGGTYADCTFGGGGHSREILKRMNGEGTLYAFDQDEDAASNLPEAGNLVFTKANFRYTARYLKLYEAPLLDGLLADLGISSHQINVQERGFSFRGNALLDMRMDSATAFTAADVVNTYDAEKLQTVLSRYGEVTNARTLAQALETARQQKALKTISDLLAVMEPLSKGNPNRYYAQVFQALRIEVNDEFGALEELLSQLPGIMKKGGRVAIITFHSLEDRIVKQFFKSGGVKEGADPVFGTRPAALFTEVYKKPIEPGREELKANPRARSARLRVAERK